MSQHKNLSAQDILQSLRSLCIGNKKSLSAKLSILGFWFETIFRTAQIERRNKYVTFGSCVESLFRIAHTERAKVTVKLPELELLTKYLFHQSPLW